MHISLYLLDTGISSIYEKRLRENTLVTTQLTLKPSSVQLTQTSLTYHFPDLCPSDTSVCDFLPTNPLNPLPEMLSAFFLD
jgi:hypothetical protein